MQDFEIKFYKKEDGSCPTIEYLNELENKLRSKVLRGMQLLENNGNELREPYSKHLGDGIFELRTKQGSDIARVLYFFIIGRKIVITHGFTKITQKTPRREIEMARKYRKDYLKREGE